MGAQIKVPLLILIMIYYLLTTSAESLLFFLKLGNVSQAKLY